MESEAHEDLAGYDHHFAPQPPSPEAPVPVAEFVPADDAKSTRSEEGPRGFVVLFGRRVDDLAALVPKPGESVVEEERAYLVLPVLAEDRHVVDVADARRQVLEQRNSDQTFHIEGASHGGDPTKGPFRVPPIDSHKGIDDDRDRTLPVLAYQIDRVKCRHAGSDRGERVATLVDRSFNRGGDVGQAGPLLRPGRGVLPTLE